MPHHAVTIIASLLLGVALPLAAHARITRIDIEKVESPTFDGASFGNSGQYEKLTGKAYGELDPAHELNRNVVLLDKAPRNAAGRVEYSHANYVAKVEAATAKLVSEGFMLKDDAARVIAEAKQRNLGF